MLANIRLSFKGLFRAKTLIYFPISNHTIVKNFITMTLGQVIFDVLIIFIEFLKLKPINFKAITI